MQGQRSCTEKVTKNLNMNLIDYEYLATGYKFATRPKTNYQNRPTEHQYLHKLKQRRHILRHQKLK
jgi:hypothetical protein